MKNFLFVCSVVFISFLLWTGCEQSAGGGGGGAGIDVTAEGNILNGTVTIVGTWAVGSRLTANISGLKGDGPVTYRWTKSGSSTSISKTATYTVKPADDNSTIRITVSREGYTGTKSAAATIGNPSFEVGDEGPAGGTIIYNNTNHSKGIDWDYMEAAPEDLGAFEWASEDETTNELDVTFSEDIGGGKENTERILDADPSAPAALAAHDCLLGGFNDWFLPSIEELELIYDNKDGIGGDFDGNFYWSSSQNGEYARYRDFTDGTKHDEGSKDDAYHVRPVRVFAYTPTPTPTPSPTTTSSPTPGPTDSPEPSPSPTTTFSPTPAPAPSPTSTSTPAPTPSPTSTSTPAPTPALINYTATANGSPTTMTTKIDFTFNESVSGLQAEHITIGGTGAATRGALTGSGTSYSLAITPTAVGEATVSIDKSGIISGTKSITLHDPLIAAIKSNSPDLSIKLGVTTGGTRTPQNVNDTFEAIHNYLALGPEVKERTSGSSEMSQGLPTKIGGIELGDYIDLVSLQIDSYQGTIDAFSAPVNYSVSGNGKILRLIVVGINSFNQNPGTGYNGGGNGNTAHLVFQFQNTTAKGSMTVSVASQPDYKESSMREYLTGDSNKFLVALINAGVPYGLMWAPRRIVGNHNGGTNELVDLVWLPTEREMFGNKTYSPNSETSANQARLAYYRDYNTRLKADSGSHIKYWTASTLIPQGNYAFTAVSDTGTPSFENVETSYPQLGIAPAFCVR
ncbi:hypothetical protein FACS1894190_16590 [Spirochaetia bacterium]|nr:hypothetical protein FACS1894190_16590 [Spirochaetia bacterium]